MPIRPDYLTLEKLFFKRLFRVANYQRAYSWEIRQRRDLFEDLEKILGYNDDRHHFMATIVCLNTHRIQRLGPERYETFDIVDGQQRLTTLVILLKSLAKAFRSRGKDYYKTADRLDELLVKEDKRLILLKTNHDDAAIFRKYLEEGIIPQETVLDTLAKQNIVNALRECEKFVQDWRDELDSVLDAVQNRLGFIFYELEEEGSVYTIFEVLNSRGLEVDALDKCKSMLMGIAFEKLSSAGKSIIDELHQVWAQIYRTIGLKKVPGHEILRFGATFKHPDVQSKILGPDASIEFFRQHCMAKPKSVLEVSQHFLNIVKALRKLNEDQRRRAVTHIAQARLLAVAIMLNDSYSVAERQKALDEWEKVTFRIFGLFGKDARTKVGEYTRLGSQVASKSISLKRLVQEVRDIGSDYAIEGAVEEVRESDCYSGLGDSLVYFFYRYEESLAARDGANISNEMWERIWSSTTADTVEHIHPQEITPTWRGKLGRGRKQLERNVHRLGNLMVLPPRVNSSAGAKSFGEKKKIYRKNRLRLMDEVLRKKDWNKTTIEEREKKLLAWAITEWG